MEGTVKLTNWSVNGNVVFENENWSCENHSHPVAAIVSDTRLDSITWFSHFEYAKKIIVKNEKVRAELQFENPLCLSTDAVCMLHLKHESEGGNSETIPKQVINSMNELSSLHHVFSTKLENCFTEEKKEHCIFLQSDVDTMAGLDKIAAHRENSKYCLQNILPLVGSSSESLPGPLKHQDSDFNSVLSWEDEFVGIHEDGLHMLPILWNDPDTGIMKPEKGNEKSLEHDPNVIQEEKENETNVIRKHKVSLNEIRKDYSHSFDSEESSVLKGSQTGKKVEQKDDECISANGSKKFQSTCGFSTISEDNKCNIAEKSTSEIGIHVEMTEEIDSSHMVVGTCLASSEHIAVSYPEKVKSKRGTAQELPAVFILGNEERSMSKSRTKEILNGSNTCLAAPKYDTEKQITGENLGNLRLSLTNENEMCLNLEMEDLQALEENKIQKSEKKMIEFNEETCEIESQFSTDQDSNSEGKPEDISGKLCDNDLIHVEDEKDLEPMQDTILTDDVISFKTEEEYQPIHPLNIEEHDYNSSNQKKENYGFDCNLRRKRSRHMEHRGVKRIRCGSPSRMPFVKAGDKEMKIRQSDDEHMYVDLKRRPVHINSLEEFEDMVGPVLVDFTSEKEFKASYGVGEPSDSKRKQIDECSLLKNDLPQKVILTPEEDLRNVLPEKRKSFKDKNQDLGFKMKTCMNTDYKKPYSCGCCHETLALILETFLVCMSIMDRNTKDIVNVSDMSVADRNMPKEDKSRENELHYKKDMKSHYEVELLKEIISTWYFFPMLSSSMELCLPSSLQAFFERLNNGPPLSLPERMSYEWLRLQSFNTLPSTTRGTAIRLAQSGFYYTGQGTHTRCYACNVEHEGWNITDDPHEVHMRISPNCPFLGGNPTYPNFPIIPDTVHIGNNGERSLSSSTPVIPIVQEGTQFRVPEPQPIIIPLINHSSTLHLDEMSVPPSAVASGYDQVPSETAQVEVRRANPETQGSSISRKQQQTNSNPSTGTSQPESSPTSSSLSHPQQPTVDAENAQYTSPGNFVLRIPTRQVEDPGVDPRPQTMSERPKHPEYAPLSSRINSYTSWPTHLDQTPQQMAEAGFFYAGIMDNTRCFQCGGGLRNWEPGDNPWIEHARWYPQCAYVLGKRGQKFVNAVLKKQAELLAAQNAEQNNSCSTTTTTTTMTITSGTGNSLESQSVQQPVSQSGQLRYFQNPNENGIAKRLIEEMGYQRERVREAILEVKRRRGQQEITIEHALELLLADEERRARTGRQNEPATMEELIQESGRLTLHDDSNPPPTATANTTAPPPTTTSESYQCSGHPHQVTGGISSGQQQSGQTNHTTGLGRVSMVPQSRQNISGLLSIAVDVPSLLRSFGNQDGHQSNKSPTANIPPSSPSLEPTSLPALDAESLREEYLRLLDQNVCKICMERNVELTFLPCGHLVCCKVCGQTLRICPICRAKINASVKTYQS